VKGINRVFAFCFYDIEVVDYFVGVYGAFAFFWIFVSECAW